jgi:iron complex outermembrane receptor protein
LVLVDGHRVNNNFNDGAFVDEAFILELDLVDRVEVIRGPGAVLYGNNAFFGVINVITRTGAQLNGFEVSGGYGSFDTYKTRVSYGNLFTNGVELLLSGTYYDSAGEDHLYFPDFDQRISSNPQAANNGVAQNMDADKSGSFFGSLGYRDFTLEGAFNHREKVNPTAYFATAFNDSRLRTTDDQGYAALKYAHSFPDVVDVTARIYGDDYTHGIGYPQSLLVGNTVVFSRFSSERDLGEWWGAELQLNKNLWNRLLLTLGAEYRDDFLQDSRVVVEDAPDQGSHTSTNRESYGVYGQADFALMTNLHLNGGVRYDQYGDFPSTVNPRLALIYHPWKESTFKAIYGTAFRAPSFYEIAYSDESLKPEKITSYELVYEQELGLHLRSSLSGFYNQMNDLLVFSSGSFTNLNADTKGLELALEGVWAGGIRGRASYSLQETRNSSVGWKMPDSPSQLVKFNLSVPLVNDKVFAGLEVQYTSDRHSLHNTTDPSGQPLTVQGEEASGFGTVNLTLLGRKLVKNLEFSASVYNLLNRQYADPASQFHVQDIIGQDGRSFRLKVTYHF